MKKLMMLSAAILALQAVPALAEQGAPPKDGKRGGPEKFFEMQDLDKDGTISEAEFLENAKSRFAKMDADKDGKLTREELSAHHEAKKKKFKERHGEKLKEKAGEIVTPAPDVVKPVTE